jgi:hypothetical protein
MDLVQLLLFALETLFLSLDYGYLMPYFCYLTQRFFDLLEKLDALLRN